MFTMTQSHGLAADSRPLLQHEITLVKNPFATDPITPAACAEAKASHKTFFSMTKFGFISISIPEFSRDISTARTGSDP